MFDLDRFIADCRLALAEDQSHKSVREVVARAVADPASVLKGLGEPRRAEVQKLYHSEDLTILAATCCNCSQPLMAHRDPSLRRTDLVAIGGIVLQKSC